MKLIVFGATGLTGLQVIKQALKKGDRVTAFVREPKGILLEYTNLEIKKGDVLEYYSVEEAVKGHDTVICCLGVKNPKDKSELRAKGTKNIIKAMESNNVKRLICLSALGTGDSYELLPPHYKYLIIPLVMKPLYKDHSKQELYIKSSQLDWTIVRPAIMTNGEHTGNYQHGFSYKKGITMKISRADVADFILKQLHKTEYLYKTPCISY